MVKSVVQRMSCTSTLSGQNRRKEEVENGSWKLNGTETLAVYPAWKKHD